MAESQVSDAVRRRGQVNPEKPFLSAIRTLLFGQRLLSEGILDYTVMNGLLRDCEGSPKDRYEAEYLKLDEAYRESRLPLVPDERLFRDLLFSLRTDDLERYDRA